MPIAILPPETTENVAGTLAERIVGRDGNQRSTKTWIPSTVLVNRLGVLGNHTTRLLAMFRTLTIHEDVQQHLWQDHPAGPQPYRLMGNLQRCNICPYVPKDPTDHDLAQRYSSIKSYAGLHQQLTEHLGSYKGFLVRSVFGYSTQPEPGAAPSSAGATPPTPAPAPTNAAPPPTTPAMNGLSLQPKP